MKKRGESSAEGRINMFIANQIPCWQQEEPLTVVGNSGLGDGQVVQVKFAPAACRYKMILVLLRVSIVSKTYCKAKK